MPRFGLFRVPGVRRWGNYALSATERAGASPNSRCVCQRPSSHRRGRGQKIETSCIGAGRVRPLLITHCGAGSDPSVQDAAEVAGARGMEVLARGGRALDAVVESIVILED